MEKSKNFCRRDLIISLFLVIIFSSIGFGSDESVSPDWICIPGVKVGPITSTTSESDLMEIFGKANVLREEIHIDEGYFEIGTSVFKGTPNEMSIFWKQQEVSDPKFPRRVIIQSAGTNWKTEDGLTIGTTIEELLKINGDHFTFAGFGWDYEGVVGP
ncbi:MAG: hypothetical protein P8Y80_02000 [Acidobacteriota bacterium]|jgi:hypothetical protein